MGFSCYENDARAGTQNVDLEGYNIARFTLQVLALMFSHCEERGSCILWAIFCANLGK